MSFWQLLAAACMLISATCILAQSMAAGRAQFGWLPRPWYTRAAGMLEGGVLLARRATSLHGLVFGTYGEVVAYSFAVWRTLELVDYLRRSRREHRTNTCLMEGEPAGYRLLTPYGSAARASPPQP